MALQSVHDDQPASWRERWLAWRDRTLANASFQRFAASFWLTRPIARWRTRQLFDLCAGFVYSQILFACVRVRLFEVLAEGPQPLGVLSRRLGLPLDGATRLLRAAVSLQLAEVRGVDRYGLGVLGAAMLGNPAIAAMVEHHALLYADLADPLELLRQERSETALGRYWAYAASETPAALNAEALAAYSSLMSSSQAFIASEALDAYPLARHRCLLDVGGGEGAFLLAAAQRTPNLRVMLFDLPPVAERARARFEAAGLGARATAFGGSFLADELPRGADVISLVRVLHDHDDHAARRILGAARRALPPHGTLLIAEPLAGTPGAEPAGDGYFGFYLWAMGSGRPRTEAEMSALLRDTGFGHVHFPATHTPLLTRVVTAVLNS